MNKDVKVTVEVKNLNLDICPTILKVEQEFVARQCNRPIKNQWNGSVFISGIFNSVTDAQNIKKMFFEGDMVKPEFQGKVLRIDW